MKSVDKLILAAENGMKSAREGNHSMKQDDTNIYYTYHDTIICTYNKREKVAYYNNGGYETSSTTRAINAYKKYYEKA